MKELSIEQKAKAYDEAIERANDIIKNQYCISEYTASFAWELLKQETNLK